MGRKVLLACLCLHLGSACPGGFANDSSPDHTGSVPASEYFGNAVAQLTIDNCADDCSLYEDCLSFEYDASSQLCQLNVLAQPTSQTSASDAEFCSKDAYLGWTAVNLMASNESFRVDASGKVMPLGAVPVGNSQAFPGPVSVIGQRDDGLVVEWSNLILKGREFSWQIMSSGLHQFTVFATEDSQVNVTFYGMMRYRRTVLAGRALLLASTGARQVDVVSTGDILVAADSAPVPPAAEMIFGQCSTVCHISVFGGNGSVPLTRSCTNGTTDTVPPGRYWQDGADYSGETCSWSAPSGYKISGHADEDGSGAEGTSFQALEHFQLVTPLLHPTQFASFVSDRSALCTHSTDGSTFMLAGKAGVYHARVPSPLAGTVITCDAPVSVVTSLGDCRSTPLDLPCNKKVLNLVTAVAFSTTSTTTTASFSTTSSTSGTTTMTSSTSGTTTATSSTSGTTTATSSTSGTTTTTSSTSSTNTTTTSGSLTKSTTSSTTDTTTETATTATDTSTTYTTSETTTLTLTSTMSWTMTTASTTTTASTVSTPTTTASTASTATTTASTASAATTTPSTSTSTETATTLSTSLTSTESTSTESTSTESTSTTVSSTASSVTATTTTSSVSTSISATPTTTASSTRTLTVSTFTVSITSSTESTSTTRTITPDLSAATTTTTTLAAPSELVKQVENVESNVLADVLTGNETSTVVVVDDFTVVAAVLNPTAALPGADNLTVPVEGSEAQVTVPVSVFEDLGVDGLVLVVSYIGPNDTALLEGSAGENDEVLSVVSVNLFNLAGARVIVDGLVQPIEIVLPALWSANMQCGYWDELDQRWSSKGLVTDVTPDGFVLCRANHLTLFAAILRGFTNTFKCSQLFLFSAEGLAELASSGWYNTETAWAFWALILVFLGLLLRAAAFDRRRKDFWSDKHFLIANDMSVVMTSELDEGTEEEGWLACLAAWLCGCRESAALRDALDDVLSNWFGNFGEVRSFFEGLWEGLEMSQCCSCDLAFLIMSSMLAHSARRQAAASLGISRESAMFVLEDEDAQDLLVGHHAQNKMLRRRSSLSSGGTQEEEEEEANNTSSNKDGKEDNTASTEVVTTGTSNVHIKRLRHMGDMHEMLGKRLEHHLRMAASWRALPCSIWRLFLWGSPFGSAMVRCMYYSSAMRVMFFMVDIFGALMLAALFFQSTGGFVSKRSRFNGCRSSGSSQGIAEYTGRLLAVGTSSMLLAGLPSMFLRSLPTRSVKRFDYKGCPEWKKQLKVWRIQDRIVWTLAILYVGFCAFFIALFLANVVPADQTNWTISGTIAVAEDVLIIPLSVALVIPLLGVVFLHLVSCMRGVEKNELVRERHMEMHKDHANLTLPLVYL